MNCPECKIGTIIEAPRADYYESESELVCNFCGLTYEPAVSLIFN